MPFARGKLWLNKFIMNTTTTKSDQAEALDLHGSQALIDALKLAEEPKEAIALEATGKLNQVDAPELTSASALVESLEANELLDSLQQGNAESSEGTSSAGPNLSLQRKPDAPGFTIEGSLEFVNFETMSRAERLSAFENKIRPLIRRYEAGMYQMHTRLKTLDNDLEMRFKHNPINHVEKRIKAPRSIMEKMQRRGYPLTIDSLKENVLDIAGIRVVANYVDDVYSLVKLLFSQDDLQILKVKDYIAHPKENGYRSLHVVLRVPVYLTDGKHMVPVEIQFRTIAMDFWASLEHALRYKGAAEVTAIDMASELKNCADMIEDVEERMQILMRAVRTTEELELSKQDTDLVK